MEELENLACVLLQEVTDQEKGMNFVEFAEKHGVDEKEFESVLRQGFDDFTVFGMDRDGDEYEIEAYLFLSLKGNKVEYSVARFNETMYNAKNTRWN